MARSNKPLVWSLFAAGGTVTAFLAPIMILILGLAVPLGWLTPDALSHDRIHGIVAHPSGRLILFGFIMVSLWHAAHRTRTTAHDLGVQNDQLTMSICYGLAGLGTTLTFVMLILF
jgi:fumarate reductase subunit D